MFERSERFAGDERFFKLFQESTKTKVGLRARKDEEVCQRQPLSTKKFLLFAVLYFLLRSDSEMLSWPNSPLLVLLQFVDPNALYGDDERGLRSTTWPILADPFDY
jgi:hypothetical protein